MTAPPKPVKDRFAVMFPGEALEYPSDEERDRADAYIAEWNVRWSEDWPPVARVHPDVSEEGFANNLAGLPTNRAYLRSQLRRWWKHPTGKPVSHQQAAQ